MGKKTSVMKMHNYYNKGAVKDWNMLYHGTIYPFVKDNYDRLYNGQFRVIGPISQIKNLVPDNAYEMVGGLPGTDLTIWEYWTSDTFAENKTAAIFVQFIGTESLRYPDDGIEVSYIMVEKVNEDGSTSPFANDGDKDSLEWFRSLKYDQNIGGDGNEE